MKLSGMSVHARSVGAVAALKPNRSKVPRIEGVRVIDRPGWAPWVTPKLLASAPIHRWFVFPHSFSMELVTSLLNEWRVSEGVVLDPFVGAGTTLVACQQAGVQSAGFDLSPLPVLVAGVKTCPPDAKQLRDTWRSLADRMRVARRLPSQVSYEDLVVRAFPGDLLPTLDRAKRLILGCGRAARVRDALLLALLRTLPLFSRLTRQGGWLALRDRSLPASRVRRVLSSIVNQMLEDIGSSDVSDHNSEVRIADARTLPLERTSVSAIVTSPPYPNRHDYTRVFGVELQFAFLDWDKTRSLRYQSFQSHPEAHPMRPAAGGYEEPKALSRVIRQISSLIADERAKARIPKMLHGYFEDIHLTLREFHRVLKPGARAALVLGNVQYCGLSVEVDRFTVEIGRELGLTPESVVVARRRGNSAQQMKDHGRRPQRESVVVFSR
jgi:hypothetical protein